MNGRIPAYRPPALRAPDVGKKERDSFYTSKRWMRVRALYLWEHPLCARCGRPAEIVHHKLERLARPDLAWDETNFEALCGPCHSAHHMRKEKGCQVVPK